MMNEERRAELRRIAEAATPGPWTQWKDHAAVFAGVEENKRGTLSGKHLVEICRCESDDLGDDDEEGEAMAQANAAHIAAFDRETCLTLLDAADRVAALEADRCPKCGMGPMTITSIGEKDVKYCSNCINQACAEEEANGLNMWKERADELEAENEQLSQRIATLEAELAALKGAKA